jgi:hypothetical protein
MSDSDVSIRSLDIRVPGNVGRKLLNDGATTQLTLTLPQIKFVFDTLAGLSALMGSQVPETTNGISIIKTAAAASTPPAAVDTGL